MTRPFRANRRRLLAGSVAAAATAAGGMLGSRAGAAGYASVYPVSSHNYQLRYWLDELHALNGLQATPPNPSLTQGVRT